MRKENLFSKYKMDLKSFVILSLGIHLAVYFSLTGNFFTSSKDSILVVGTPASELTYVSIEEKNQTSNFKQKSQPLQNEKIEKSDVVKKVSAVQNTEVNQTGKPSQTANSVSGTGGALHPLSDYSAGLRKLIDSQKIYPSLSKKMGETGIVTVSLELLKDGTIKDVQIKTSSKFARLNQAALQTASAVKKYRPLPESISGDQLNVEVPIEFSL